MDIYSSGLNLLALGVRLPRHKSVLIDGVMMIAGSIYIIFSPAFFAPFQGFLITLGVALATWSAIFLTDLVLYRRGGYAEGELYDARGRYGAVNVAGVTAFAGGTAVGRGVVTSTSPALGWAGYRWRRWAAGSGRSAPVASGSSWASSSPPFCTR
jgi:nucleobase:cation symporter-1, NCS1 family